MAEERANSTEADSGRSPVGFWRWLWRISAGIFAVFVVLLALFIGLFRVAVPLFPDIKQRIETAATGALGYPLSVGSIDARWRFAGPELVLDNVIVSTQDNQRELLRANRFRVAIDTMALLKGGAISPSSLTLTGAQLIVRRDTEGRWFIQDIPLDSLRSDSPMNFPWGVADGVFGVHNVSLIIRDEINDTSFTVPDIDVNATVTENLISVLGEFELRRRGPRVSFSLDANGRADHPEQVVWTGFVGGSHIDWANVEALLPQELAWTTAEPVDFSVWVRAKGQTPREANVTIDAENVVVNGDERMVATVAGSFSWVGEPGSWQLTGENVDISSADNSVAGLVRLAVGPQTRVPDEKGPQGKLYSFVAAELNLEQLALLASPVDPKVKQWVTDYAPTGRIRDLDGFVSVKGEKPGDFGLTATINRAGINAAEGRPGFMGVDAQVFGGRESGGITLLRGQTISLPGIIREQVALDSMAANVVWESQADEVRIAISELALANADIEVAGNMEFERASVDDDWMGDMSLSIGRMNLARAWRYFPVNKFSPKLLNWLDNALTAGTGTQGTFELNGPLNKFPYADPDTGNFTATIRLNDATLHYANNWPDATEVDAIVSFERNSLRASEVTARLLTLPVINAQATIDDLKKSVIHVEGAVTGQLDEMRAFLSATPIDDKWGESWPDAQFYGNGNAQLSLTLPTKRREDTQFDVALQFNEARFLFRDWRQTVTNVRGELRASRAGLSGSGIRGSFLGEPVDIGISPSTVEGYTSDIVLKGTAHPSSLARNLHEGLADHLSGAADWTASIALPRADSSMPLQVRLRSPLQGMAVTLPAPLVKTARESRFADALLTVLDDGKLVLSADYGEGTNIMAQVRRDDEGYWTVPRGELRFGGGSALMPANDLVRVTGSVDLLDMSHIVDFTRRFASSRPWIELGTAELAVSELVGLKQNFGATTLNMVHDSRGYVLNFVGDKLSGGLTVPVTITPETPIIGQFETLHWTSTNDNTAIDPRDAPSLRALVDNFRFNDFELGALVAHLEARENLVAIREFTTTASAFSTRTTGSWVFGEESSTTYLVSELKSDNVQETLKSLGLAEFMDAANASARLEMSWPNGWTPDYLQTVEGELSVQVGQGKLVSVDPGAGRVFGLLSIGALPRRLNLDFRDVFDSGFGFDSITGDFVIREGDAVTDNLALSGPAANVVVVGRTGLIKKDYDQTALVFANFGSSLPIAGAIAGGPALGAALLVVTEIFKRPLQNMGKVSYSITGSWDDPVVAKTGAAPPAVPESENSEPPPAEGVPAEDVPVQPQGPRPDNE